ncbi:MAG TPA: sialidase family protein [Candidatus Limnocylindria bacterium]|nr:sialidase family protein [Candidatus Limnocylindria bacterium]
MASITPAAAVSSIDPGGDGDDAVTGQLFVRHDGGSDDAIEECNNAGTSTVPDTDATDGDTDNNDGGSRRQGNEPFAVIDPTDPDTVVTGWNDYCQTDLGAGWQGFGYSRDGGETWVNSFVPGYPADSSAEGMQSPLHGNHTDAGDPIAAFDNSGRLFVGGISFNRTNAILGHVYVASYAANDVVIPGPTADYPVDYLRTRIVGVGTPSRNFFGIFQDKPMLEVDRTGGDTDGNVYVCWSRFTGLGVQNKIYFSRSTDHGNTFSSPIALTRHGFTGAVQGCDIAIEGDGDVYVTFRTFDDASVVGENRLYFVRSTNGGASFGRPHKIVDFTPYNPFDGSRDCGDGTEACPSGFVFARTPLEPRVTADQNSATNGVWLTYFAVDPATIEPSETSYMSAGGGNVGRSVVYVVRSTDNGGHWSGPVAVDPSPADPGHQFFSDIDALNGTLAVMWQDSRSDPCYSVQLPMGNTEDAESCGTNIVNTFVASSTNGGATWSASLKVSDVAHQPQYEMFSNRSVPFQGDYNWISIVDTGAGLEAYTVWTDNRNVVEGTDPRESVQDGFDVWQCRVETSPGVWSSDRCANAGGVNQDIFGNRVALP